MEWIKDQDQIRVLKDSPTRLKDKVEPLEKIAWKAIACAYGQPHLIQGYLRLFHSLLEREEEALAQRRFQNGAAIQLSDISWESFKELLEKYQEGMKKGK